jgi:beta-phosphoglucomutase
LSELEALSPERHYRFPKADSYTGMMAGDGNDFEAVLFDFDGVLIDSEPVHFDCWREVLRPFGLELDWQTYVEKAIGVADRAMLEMYANLCTPPVNPEDLWLQYPAKKALFRERILGAEAVPEGMLDFINSINCHRLAVVTSSSRSEVGPILEHYGLMPLFPVAVFSEDVRNHKPSPEPYLLAAQRLGVSRALVVEDSDAGEQSGLAAGFQVLRVRSAAEVPEVVGRALRCPGGGRGA